MEADAIAMTACQAGVCGARALEAKCAFSSRAITPVKDVRLEMVHQVFCGVADAIQGLNT